MSILACSFLLLVCFAGPSAGSTTEVKIQKIAADGITVLNETTVDYRWMEQHLPVMGDGSTHYYLQGPVFVDNPEDRWNPAEDTNVREKDMGAIKGTDLADLCDLVGGMSDGDEVVVQASDGFKKTFASENVYSPPSRQGPIVIAWYEGTKGYVPSYADGMRLLFMPDASGNPWGIHAMGVWDWHESASEKYWYYYYNGNEMYPTTTGLSVRSVSDILILSQEEPAGTIRVTSQPGGAHIFIDGDEVPDRTPADLTGIPAGTYAVRAELDGYEVPEEVLVEVEHMRIAEAHFDLLPVSDEAEEDTSDSGDAGMDRWSGADGSALSLYSAGKMQGTVSMTVIPGLDGPMHGGQDRAVNVSNLPPNEENALVRLYIFSSNGTDHRTGSGAVPAFELKRGNEILKPDSYFEDRGANQTDGTIVTTTFAIPGNTSQGKADLIMRLADSPDISCQVQGGAVIRVSRDPAGRSAASWIFEGADLIAALPGTGRPEAETGTEFELSAKGEAYAQGRLWFISTGGADDPAGRYQVQLNGEMHTGMVRQEEGNVQMAEVPFLSPSPGSSVSTAIRATVNDTYGLYGETRLVAFTLEGEKIQADLNPDETLSPAATRNTAAISVSPVPSSHQTPGPSQAGVNPPPSGDADGPLHQSPTSTLTPPGTPAGGPVSWFAPITDRITAFLILLFGEPAGTGTEEGITGLLAWEQTAGTPDSGTTGGQEPPGIQADPDAKPGSDSQGGIAPDGSELRDSPFTKDPGPPEPQSGAKDIPPEMPDTLQSPGTGIDLIESGTETGDVPSFPSRNRTRHGGIAITSYPENVDVRIDNKLVNSHIPAVVYGLKEGNHLVDVRLKSESGTIIGTQSARVYVPADTITTARFDLIRTVTVQNIRVITQDNATASFTVNGYYPLRKTPADVQFSGLDSFITVSREEAYLTLTPTTVTEAGIITIADTMPPLYRLRVVSEPSGGDIWIDGFRTGLQTPAVVPNVSAGPHRVMVHLPGHVPGDQVFLVPVDGGPDVKESVSYVLETYPSGPLIVESIPPGASISLDGISTGERTPFSFQYIPLGIHVVTVTRNGESRKADVIVKPGESRRYIIEFEGNGTRDG